MLKEPFSQRGPPRVGARTRVCAGKSRNYCAAEWFPRQYISTSLRDVFPLSSSGFPQPQYRSRYRPAFQGQYDLAYIPKQVQDVRPELDEAWAENAYGINHQRYHFTRCGHFYIVLVQSGRPRYVSY